MFENVSEEDDGEFICRSIVRETVNFQKDRFTPARDEGIVCSGCLDFFVEGISPRGNKDPLGRCHGFSFGRVNGFDRSN